MLAHNSPVPPHAGDAQSITDRFSQRATQSCGIRWYALVLSGVVHCALARLAVRQPTVHTLGQTGGSHDTVIPATNQEL